MQKEKERLEELGGRLGLLQRQCKEAGIPVLILFDGYDAAGKGYQINRLLQRRFVYVGGNYSFGLSALQKIKAELPVVTTHIAHRFTAVNKRGSH